MTSVAKKIKQQHLKTLLKRASLKSKKNPSSFFGKLKDGVDGLTYQKRLRDEWSNLLVDTNFFYLLNGHSSVTHKFEI